MYFILVKHKHGTGNGGGKVLEYLIYFLILTNHNLKIKWRLENQTERHGYQDDNNITSLGKFPKQIWYFSGLYLSEPLSITITHIGKFRAPGPPPLFRTGS